jgi:hypothetical protein
MYSSPKPNVYVPKNNYSSPKANVYVPKWNYNLETIINRLDQWMNYETDIYYTFYIKGDDILVSNKSKYIYANINRKLQYKMNDKYVVSNQDLEEFNELQYVNSLLCRILSTF